MYRVLELNPQLQPYAGDIDLRMANYERTKSRLVPEGKTLNDFANAHHYYGFHRTETGWVYREWAPSAYQLYNPKACVLKLLPQNKYQKSLHRYP